MKKFKKIYEEFMEKYELIEVAAEREMKADNAGGYGLFGIKDGKLRIDWVTGDEPAFSVVGSSPAAVYKRVADELDNRGITVSTEHAMYIGKELQRAFSEGSSFVQEQVNIKSKSV
jgi:hypothetical protein